MSLMLLVIAASVSTQFAVPSTSDRALIYGQVDNPSGRTRAVVVMVPGYGGHNRDMRTTPGSVRPPSYFFRDLASELNKVGIGTVRYDSRGFSCFKPGASFNNPLRDRCNDPRESGSTNMETSLGDVEAIMRYAAKIPGGRCLILLGHSQAADFLGRLIEQDRINPSGAIILAGIMMSWPELGMYQRVDANIRALEAADSNHDGVTSATELITFADQTVLAGKVRSDGSFSLNLPLDGQGEIAMPAGGWTSQAKAQLRARLLADWHAERERSMRISPATPSIVGGNIPYEQAGMANFQRNDWVPIARRWSSFKGPFRFHQGTLDGQIDIPANLQALTRWGPRQATSVLYPGLSHFFARGAGWGPVEPSVKRAIVADARAMADSCAKKGPGRQTAGAS